MGKRFSRLILEIQPFALYHQRTVVHLGMYIPDVLANNSHEEKLERSQEEHSDGDGGDADREVFPKHQFVGKVGHASQQRKQGPGKTGKLSTWSASLATPTLISVA